MKSVFLLVFLLAIGCQSALAGSSGCSNTSSLSWAQGSPLTNLDPTQCIVNATQSNPGTSAQNVSLLAFLPTNPSDGDTFTIVDQTPFYDDVCVSWYDDPAYGGSGNTYTGCQPGGTGFESTDKTVDGSQSDTLSEFYFTQCVDPSNNLCTPDELPSYWSDFPKVRYSYTATYSAATGDWATTYTQNQ